jgi:hypothetical protein
MTRHELAKTLEGKTIAAVKHDRAYGDMDGEIGDVTIMFTDGSELRLHAVGYDPDGIGFDYSGSSA